MMTFCVLCLFFVLLIAVVWVAIWMFQKSTDFDQGTVCVLVAVAAAIGLAFTATHMVWTAQAIDARTHQGSK